ncbi:MAG: UDP-glucose/GDP-mannose dehydrogenase family protein [Flavobacteriales bacterium]|jgi:UDPglucose 6-dehydrogenase|nr:UDP-glucose/GDP-mannose dehydrogenase family protein [Flavobacteriales bacterium]MDG2224939.1 UDP-glucose/GDP-mannose dehydrogenase family protein [Schleiferiaceae bacterium]MBT3572502.1 UDP-glucose/GDP-mannose dehydrogenase family protein [Flavobacteriales bacterium]MBT3739854.1 UDP-glucose/GDP-mannose dehydrogenase family protein [Flavobacteriales bacterium]MBT4102571.1 UDP-glucose/GDP-mannose dehydrogenase family protein [Flavobacteriales bacterium]
MKITVVGTGYVGLVSGACLADVGMDVTCVDIDQQKIANLKKGILPIYEPGLDHIVSRNVAAGRLHFTSTLSDAIVGSETVFIAVGTPPGEDGSADLQYVLKVAQSIGEHMQDYLVVVTKSTVPVGTASKVQSTLQSALTNRGLTTDFDVASNPEFLKEGAAIDDFMRPDRIVCGVDNERAEGVLSRLYKPFTLNGHPVLFMDIPSAEMTKYAANAMLATKISFMNDIALLCEVMGADVNQVRKGIGSDPRIGHKFIYPGIGYGGSCFPKDVKALVRAGEENGHALRILQAVEDVNDDQKQVMVKKVMAQFGQDLTGKHFAMWGLSFKPETDDMREAPSVVIANALLEAGATVAAYDPVATEEAKHQLGDRITYANDAYAALEGADALLLVTEWREFRMPNWDRVKEALQTPVVIDGRNIFDAKVLRDQGFVYQGIGIL